MIKIFSLQSLKQKSSSLPLLLPKISMLSLTRQSFLRTVGLSLILAPFLWSSFQQPLLLFCPFFAGNFCSPPARPARCSPCAHWQDIEPSSSYVLSFFEDPWSNTRGWCCQCPLFSFFFSFSFWHFFISCHSKNGHDNWYYRVTSLFQ